MLFSLLWFFEVIMLKLHKCFMLAIVFCVIFSFAGCSKYGETEESSKNSFDACGNEMVEGESESNESSSISDNKEKNNIAQQDNPIEDSSQIIKNIGTMIPVVIIWKGNLYIGSSNTLTDDDLNEFLVDSENISVYSISGTSSAQAIAYRVNNCVYQYTCVCTAPISINNNSYLFVPKGTVTVNKISETPICTVEEIRIYLSNNPEYLIADISSKLGLAEPCLYEIKKQ